MSQWDLIVGMDLQDDIIQDEIYMKERSGYMGERAFDVGQRHRSQQELSLSEIAPARG